MELFGANGTSQFLVFNYDKREIVLKAVTNAITAQIGSYIGYVSTPHAQQHSPLLPL